MGKVEVDISELKNEGGDVIKELAEFLKEKTKAKVDTLTDAVAVEGNAVSKKHLRVLVRKFLHKAEIKKYYRVISSDEGSLIIKERKPLKGE